MKALWNTFQTWVMSHGGWAHILFASWMIALGAYTENQPIKAAIDSVYALIPTWGHTLILAVFSFIMWYTNTRKALNVTNSAAMAQKVGALLLVGIAMGTLTGCPSSSATQRQQVAQAVDNASIVVKDFQQAEITSYQIHLISPLDHAFIQRQLVTVATVGKTADSCIRSTTASSGVVLCLDSAMSAIDEINTAGGLGIKSDQARGEFQIAMSGVKGALKAIEAVLLPPQPAPAQ